METLPETVARVSSQVRGHCQAKGYQEGPWLNPLVPVDCVAALVMAQRLIASGRFDHYLAVAPEGHVYGYFFEQLGAPVLSALVDYPPRRCQVLDDLAVIRDGSVLIIEDDVLSGISLALVVDQVMRFAPRSVSLYLGREKEYQQLHNVPAGITTTYLAEEQLDPALRAHYESEFLAFFREHAPPKGSQAC